MAGELELAGLLAGLADDPSGAAMSSVPLIAVWTAGSENSSSVRCRIASPVTGVSSTIAARGEAG